MHLLLPILKPTAMSLVMTPEFLCLYVIVTTNITYSVFADLYLFLLKNPKALGSTLSLQL